MKRLTRFVKLMNRYGMHPGDYDTGGEEDPRPYINGKEELGRFVCVTVNYSCQGHPRHFFLSFQDIDDARERTTEYAGDDIFEELPVSIVDLDTGETLKPLWGTLQWTQDKTTEDYLATSRARLKTPSASKHRCVTSRASRK